MKVTILGSGTMLSEASRKPSAFLLESTGQRALLDMGPGILGQLKILELDLLSINTIYVTHFHLDHCADIFPFLMNRYLIKKDANLNLRVYGPKGLQTWFEILSKTQGSWLQEYPPELFEITEKIFNWAKISINVFRTGHTENSIAYRFEGKETYFFSGDTDYGNELIEFSKDSDFGFLECSHPDSNKMEGHLTPSEAGRFALLANFKHLIINHIYPENDTPDLRRKIAKYFQGKITIAEDLMTIS